MTCSGCLGGRRYASRPGTRTARISTARSSSVPMHRPGGNRPPARPRAAGPVMISLPLDVQLADTDAVCQPSFRLPRPAPAAQEIEKAAEGHPPGHHRRRRNLRRRQFLDIGTGIPSAATPTRWHSPSPRSPGSITAITATDTRQRRDRPPNSAAPDGRLALARWSHLSPQKVLIAAWSLCVARFSA